MLFESITIDIILYSPALTFGQEVGQCDYWGSHLTENAL